MSVNRQEHEGGCERHAHDCLAHEGGPCNCAAPPAPRQSEEGQAEIEKWVNESWDSEIAELASEGVQSGLNKGIKAAAPRQSEPPQIGPNTVRGADGETYILGIATSAPPDLDRFALQHYERGFQDGIRKQAAAQGREREALAWITSRVLEGKGAVHFGIIEDGNMAVWIGEEESCRGIGDDALSVIQSAIQSERRKLNKSLP